MSRVQRTGPLDRLALDIKRSSGYSSLSNDPEAIMPPMLLRALCLCRWTLTLPPAADRCPGRCRCGVTPVLRTGQRFRDENRWKM